ncbi:hypothetical protein PR048_027574 [Dryococelus australis]|uniref:Uncharacterized protein n=1 Tax=Dryococelus australis TaxID=614101 RepID=A0ABQ9GGX3_9NEOP|nr:hypothetical protein PR048_027574 [Dryococelus australis]
MNGSTDQSEIYPVGKGGMERPKYASIKLLLLACKTLRRIRGGRRLCADSCHKWDKAYSFQIDSGADTRTIQRFVNTASSKLTMRIVETFIKLHRWNSHGLLDRTPVQYIRGIFRKTTENRNLESKSRETEPWPSPNACPVFYHRATPIGVIRARVNFTASVSIDLVAPSRPGEHAAVGLRDTLSTTVLHDWAPLIYRGEPQAERNKADKLYISRTVGRGEREGRGVFPGFAVDERRAFFSIRTGHGSSVDYHHITLVCSGGGTNTTKLRGVSLHASTLTDRVRKSLALSELRATVAERLERSPPTKANRVQSPAGSTDFRKREIVQDAAVGRWVFSGISRFPRPFIPAPLHTHLDHPTSALKTPLLRTAQISSLTHSLAHSTQSRAAFVLVCYLNIRRLSRPAPISGAKKGKQLQNSTCAFSPIQQAMYQMFSNLLLHVPNALKQLRLGERSRCFIVAMPHPVVVRSQDRHEGFWRRAVKHTNAELTLRAAGDGNKVSRLAP